MTSQPANQNKSRWCSFLQGAVAGIEGRLDALLAEDGVTAKSVKASEKSTDQQGQKIETGLQARTPSGMVYMCCS